MRFRLAPRILSVCILFLSPDVRAQWQPDGVPICTAASGQFSPRIISDGAGGAIVAWYDGRSGTFDYPIYAQRVNAAGVPLWTVDGVALTVASGAFAVISDGAGGAIVTWGGARAQRVNASGVPLWTANGIALSTAVGGKIDPAIVSDDAGGAIVVWKDYRNNKNKADLFAQRVNASGVLQWDVSGVALCTDTTAQQIPKIASDGAGGAIVAWADDRNDVVGFKEDIYAQRINAAGVPQWTVDGVLLCAAVNHQVSPAPVIDGAGGAIVTWVDYRSGTTDIYAQRVSALGTTQWTADGVALCTAAHDQWQPAILSDDAGGAIVSWEDIRGGATADIYAQRVDGSGVPQWTANGVALCTQPYYQYDPALVSDGTGGAIVTWEDPRDGLQFDIYAQHVDASGTPRWIADGIALCVAAGDQRDPAIASDGAGGAIAAWTDRRSGPTTDVYAQHMTDPLNAVAIASFDASESGGVVTLHSAFRSDLGVEAVNVYRASGVDNDQMIVIERVNDVPGDRFEYVDRDVAPGQSYRYQIGVVDADGEFFSPIVTVSVKTITTRLEQNQPNPFNPVTTIRFVLPVREDVALSIYDASGHLVRTLVHDVREYGAHEVTWDGRDDNGAVMGSGVYFCRLRAGTLTESRKMVLLK